MRRTLRTLGVFVGMIATCAGGAVLLIYLHTLSERHPVGTVCVMLSLLGLAICCIGWCLATFIAQSWWPED